MMTAQQVGFLFTLGRLHESNRIGRCHVMHLTYLRILNSKSLPLWLAFTISLLLVLISCGDKHESAAEKTSVADSASFTFFELGKNSKVSTEVRNNLRDLLGREAIERRSILDLEINYNGFIKQYFPEIDALNQKLNFPPGERVEHNTVKLMYRYARKKNVPFELVELVFSDYTKTPIVFNINFKEDEANIVETLQEKYGSPQVISWNNEDNKSMFWNKNGDVLVISRALDRRGNYTYQIVIYFIDNLKNLIETERKEKETKELQRAKTGKKAF